MSEGTALPLVVVFGVITVMLVRSNNVRWWEATVTVLFGVYLALTPAVFMITDLVQWIIARFTA